MSGHYEEQEIKIVEVTYVCDNEFDCERHVSYELRAYYGNGEEDYEFLLSRDNLADLILSMRQWMMYICPKCGSPTNYKQHYTYYWVTDIDTGIPYMERQPYGMYHECLKCSWTDRFAEEPDNESDGLLTVDDIRDAMKKIGVEWDGHEN